MKNEDEEFYKKAKYKTSQIHIILGIEKEATSKVHKVNGKSIKAFKFSKKDIIEDKLEDKNKNLFDSVDVEDKNNFF